MPTTYKVLGQAATVSASTSITNKAVSNNVVTLTSASAHNIVVGQPVTVSEATASATVTNKVLTNNVATLTSANHRIQVGQSITVAGVDATFNGTYTVTTTTASTVSYAKTNANIASASSSGTMAFSDLAFNGTFIVDSDPTTTTFTYTTPNNNLTSASANITAVHIPWIVAYTCPANTSAVISSVVICNQNEIPVRYQMAIANTTNLENKHLLYNNDILDNFDSITITTGMTLDQSVKYLMVASDVASVSVNVFGAEIS